MRSKALDRKAMTAEQEVCFDLLCDVFYGEHHCPDVSGFGRGIKANVYSGQMATFDFDYLTRLVVLAHDRCVRVEICQGGPGRVGVVLHKRFTREGDMYKRHPTMEAAVAGIRAKHPVFDANGPTHVLVTQSA